MSRGLGKIERTIEALMWQHARDVEVWRPGGYHVHRTASELAARIHGVDPDEATAAQLRAVYRAMHSLSRKSPCFRLEGGKGREPLCLSYEIPAPLPPKRRAPGAGRKPAPPMSENDLKELLDRRVTLYRSIAESRRKRAAR